jgi:hypothetical protein
MNEPELSALIPLAAMIVIMIVIACLAVWYMFAGLKSKELKKK